MQPFYFLLILIVTSRASDKRVEHVSEYSFILNQTFTGFKDNSRGSNELIIARNGFVGRDTLAYDAEESLRLLEVTNGTEIIQLIFSPKDTLIDCDVSNSRLHIHKLLKHVYQKHHDKAVIYRSVAVDSVRSNQLLDMNSWTVKCTELHSQHLFKKEGLLPVEETETGAETKRAKRGFMDLIYPGKCGLLIYSHHQFPLELRCRMKASSISSHSV